LRSLHENDDLLLTMTILFIYGFFVIVGYVQNLAWATMSGATGWWYYFKESPTHRYRFPITRSLGIMTFFHTGSLAFAAFIIAIFDFIRFVILYVERQITKTGANKNAMMAILVKCLLYCVACIQRTVKFVSYYGLVFVAVNGNSFCGGCVNSFSFFARNLSQVSINALVVSLMRMFWIGTTPLMCGVVALWLLDYLGNTSPFWPAFFVFVAAVVLTGACMSVFECVITTIFTCSFEDKAKYGAKYMRSHPHLMDVFELEKDSPAAEKTSLKKDADVSLGDTKQAV